MRRYKHNVQVRHYLLNEYNFELMLDPRYYLYIIRLLDSGQPEQQIEQIDLIVLQSIAL